MALSGYGVADGAGYDQQANDLQYRYNTDKSTNAYGRFLSQQRGDRSMADLSQGLSRGLPGFKAAFGQRGLSGPGVKSGSMQRSMQNYLGDYSRDYGRAAQDATQEAQNYDLQSAQLDAYLNSSLAGLQAQKQTDIANAALAIEALRPYLGGT
jgi:hypothetical protein